MIFQAMRFLDGKSSANQVLENCFSSSYHISFKLNIYYLNRFMKSNQKNLSPYFFFSQFLFRFMGFNLV